MKLFESYPVLENDNVLLRKLTLEDAPALRSLTECDEMYRTLPTFLYERKYADPREVIARMDEECFQTKESLLLGIFLKQEDPSAPQPLVGIAEVYGYEENKEKASVGCRLNPSVWGRGIGYDINELLKNYLLRDVGLRTLTGHILRSNEASARVAEKGGWVNKYPGLWEDWGTGDLLLTDKYVFKREWLGDGSPAARPLSGAEKIPPVDVERFSADYAVPAEQIGPFLPDGFHLLRPVLRILTEIRTEIHVKTPAGNPAGAVAANSVKTIKAYLEINTPAGSGRREGWLNLLNRKSTNDALSFELHEREVTITAPFLSLTYVRGGTAGAAPSELFEGCFYVGGDTEYRPFGAIEGQWEVCTHTLRLPDQTSPAAGSVSEAGGQPFALAEILSRGQLLSSGILHFRRE